MDNITVTEVDKIEITNVEIYQDKEGDHLQTHVDEVKITGIEIKN